MKMHKTIFFGCRIFLILLVFTAPAFSKSKISTSDKDSAGTTSSAYTAPVEEFANPGCGAGVGSPLSNGPIVVANSGGKLRELSIADNLAELQFNTQILLMLSALLIGAVGLGFGFLIGVISPRRSREVHRGKVLATVGGMKITTGQLNKLVNAAVAEGVEDTPELRQSLLKDLAVREAVAQDLAKSGFLNKDNNALKLEVARQKAILEMWFLHYFQSHPLTDAEVRSQYYKELEDEKYSQNSQEFLLSQIVVASESEGVEIVNQLNGGQAFEVLAKEKSLDRDSGEKGGLLGWALSTQITPPIDQVIKTLSIGQVTPPIQTKMGWHIVRVDNIKPFVPPSFEEVKIGIAQKMADEKRQVAIAELMKRVKYVKT